MSGAPHAGEARRMAMDLAMARLEEIAAARSVILTTDADSRVAPNWIDGNINAINAGVDAVLGRLALDEDGRKLPEAVHRRGALESEYEELLTEVFATLDPVVHNPWPHHSTISGASIAITTEAYRRIGGLPRVARGEDKALVAELLRRDAASALTTPSKSLPRPVSKGGRLEGSRTRYGCGPSSPTRTATTRLNPIAPPRRAL